VRHPRGVAGWIGLTVLVTVAASMVLCAGLALFVLAIVAWLVNLAVRLTGICIEWFWYLEQRVTGRGYPFRLRRPVRRAARRSALNDGYLQTFPRAVGLAARVAGFLFTPLALLASVAGIFSSHWRARPYVALFSLPALERKLTGLGRRRGFFNDGVRPHVVPYDRFLAEIFPQRANFLSWWRDPNASQQFEPVAAAWDDPSRFAGLALGPVPDVLGLPGLALVAMRRTSISGLRELFISQREIDDLGDPDLDGRGECAVIRIVDRPGADGVRRWIVQFPSTQVWHPRSGQAPNDLTADLVALSLTETTLTRAAFDAMHQARIGKHDHVLVAGFSLGGLIAGQVAERAAERGFTVTHLLTAGAPIGRDRIDPSIHVLSIEHLLDPVPRLEGRENPVWSERIAGAPEWVTVKAGPPLPRGYHVAVTHHSPSYAETAGAVEDDPPDDRVIHYLNGDEGATGVLAFFGPDQRLRDYAATRAAFRSPQVDVPLSFRPSGAEGITRESLRITLRRVPGVIAVDIYPSRTGFPTTVLWSADVLVRSLTPWFTDVERTVVYRALLSRPVRRRAAGVHLRLQAKDSPGVTWESTVQRTLDGRWRELVDVSFDTDAAERRYLPVLLPDGWTSRITYYAGDAFD
jgi:hypothetical protein